MRSTGAPHSHYLLFQRQQDGSDGRDGEEGIPGSVANVLVNSSSWKLFANYFLSLFHHHVILFSPVELPLCDDDWMFFKTFLDKDQRGNVPWWERERESDERMWIELEFEKGNSLQIGSASQLLFLGYNLCPFLSNCSLSLSLSLSLKIPSQWLGAHWCVMMTVSHSWTRRIIIVHWWKTFKILLKKGRRQLSSSLPSTLCRGSLPLFLEKRRREMHREGDEKREKITLTISLFCRLLSHLPFHPIRRREGKQWRKTIKSWF